MAITTDRAVPLLGVKGRLLGGHLARLGWNPAVVELFTRTGTTDGNVLWACRNDPERVAALAAHVAEYRPASFSCGSRERIRDLAKHLYDIAKEART